MSAEDKEREELKKLGDDFLKAMKEEVNSCILLCDTDRLHGLIRQVNIYLGYCLIHDLRENGFEEEIRKLCEKAGRSSKRENLEEEASEQ